MSMDTTKYKPYPAYKESRVEWLGKVPEHWKVKRLKYNLRLLTEKTDRRENPIALENIQSWSGRFIPTETVFEGEGVAFSPGDILFGKLRPYLAKAILTEFSGEAVGDFFVMRPSQDVNGNFILYQILNKEFISIVDGSTFGAKMPRVSWEFMSGMILAMPPDDEQHTIAAFLDRETAKIDTLIAKQERLIELLQEKRTALISHAVTKGLNPDAPMKESRVEWLGEVPEYWEVKSFRHCAWITEGQVNPSDVRYNDLILIAPNHIESGTGKILYTETASEQVAISGKYPVKAGEIIYSKIRPGLNKVCIATEDCLCSADMYPIRPLAGVEAVFLYYLMLCQAFVKLVVDESMRVAMPKVNRETLTACRIPVPPPPEQFKIAGFLDLQTAKIDTLITKSRRAIDLLKERRTALISAAVTGKIDVRDIFQSDDEKPLARLRERGGGEGA